MRLGLTWVEAKALSVEEVLCLLHHAELEESMQYLHAESARVASLSFADPHEQQRALSTLAHRAAALLDRFYRRIPN